MNRKAASGSGVAGLVLVIQNSAETLTGPDGRIWDGDLQAFESGSQNNSHPALVRQDTHLSYVQWKSILCWAHGGFTCPVRFAPLGPPRASAVEMNTEPSRSNSWASDDRRTFEGAPAGPRRADHLVCTVILHPRELATPRGTCLCAVSCHATG